MKKIVKYLKINLIILSVLLIPKKIHINAQAPQSSDSSSGLSDSVVDNLITAKNAAGIGEVVHFRDALVNIINAALTLLGIIFVVLLIYGGFLYMTAGGNQDNVDKGRKVIIWAVVGIAIIIASFAISFFIVESLVKSTDSG